ncbi:crossover junction endodeoxyribonuclease RuvC [Wenzhouxiangella marina]|uniref:Crossover junction endodeoxyribonuclease RuvC n=1 Tax=Wenzhouxiangella marina TaxID=1579979 RepID=A0A0K0XT54_9GAMM|nr:crossover junction endodeoxyribonuclease RuvC [Wenzhouxiangella marina]AKS40894.1 Crossover junction endodeoxyribonuclease RuvC [Wenzhouxiangella marina]MBB6087768.1 crossover junction endodeoxyribonuclease RuvC [Wenzhouxiangella marina]
MRILGIDPGSRITGVGIIDGERLVHAESLRLGSGPMPERLGEIYRRLTQLLAEFQPEVAAVETVFMSRNPQAAIKLGQARGAAICALVGYGLDVHEYAPRAIKQALVGRGAAAKEQVQHMTRAILKTRQPFGEDAADALAVALCHHHTSQTNARLPAGVVLR